MTIEQADEVLTRVLGPDLQAATFRLVALLGIVAAIVATASFFAA